MKTVPQILEKGAKTFRERQKSYGPSYRRFGKLMMSLFPDGIEIKDEETWVRFGILAQISTKLMRYAETLNHEDSAHDMCVYSAILEEVTQQPIRKRTKK